MTVLGISYSGSGEVLSEQRAERVAWALEGWDVTLPSPVSKDEVAWVANACVELAVAHEAVREELIRVREHFRIVHASPKYDACGSPVSIQD